MFGQTRWLSHSEHIKSKNSENSYQSYLKLYYTIYIKKLSGNVVDRINFHMNWIKWMF